MARNRRRPKERRRTSSVAARPGDGRVGPDDEHLAPAEERTLSAPDPIAHATPDAELAAAQLAVGDIEPDGELEPDTEAELEALAIHGDGEGQPRRPGAASSTRAAAAGGLGARERAAAPARVSPLARLLAFLRGSWAELQRVQWPDRRQVVQATSVVIGFVIVAGVFLGLSDLAATHLIDWILK